VSREDNGGAAGKLELSVTMKRSNMGANSGTKRGQKLGSNRVLIQVPREIENWAEQPAAWKRHKAHAIVNTS
jgi:hypothetical protein